MTSKQQQNTTGGNSSTGKNGTHRKATVLDIEIAFTVVPENVWPQEWQYCSASEATQVSLFRRVHLPTQPDTIQIREAAVEWVADYSLKSIDLARDAAIRMARASRVELIGNAVSDACRRRLPAVSHCYLDISTLHLRKQTLLQLETKTLLGLDVMDLDMGLLLPVPEAIDAPDLPPDLDAIFDYAKEVGCGYVRLEPSGTKYASLPQYWDDPH